MDESKDQVGLVPVGDHLSGESLMSGGLFSRVDWAGSPFPSFARTGDTSSFRRDTDPASEAFCSLASRRKSPHGGTSKSR